MKIIVVIPARMGSTCFPGKPLAPILGPSDDRARFPTHSHVPGDDGFVVTCDQQNMDAVNAFGGNPIMTSSSHQRVSERVAESIDMLRFIENGCKVKRVQTAHCRDCPPRYRI